MIPSNVKPFQCFQTIISTHRFHYETFTGSGSCKFISRYRHTSIRQCSAIKALNFNITRPNANHGLLIVGIENDLQPLLRRLRARAIIYRQCTGAIGGRELILQATGRV